MSVENINEKKKNELKGIHIKNRVCYDFDDIILKKLILVIF